MTGKFKSFVILAGMRTGSNLLEANLNALGGVTCYGEVFNPHFIGKKNAEDLFGVTLAQREKDPRPLLGKLRSETEGLSGFRLFHDHDQRVLKLVLADPACAKIILTRNPVDSYVSLEIARTTGQWKLADAKRLRTTPAKFDEPKFRDHLAAGQAFQLHIMSALQTTGQTAFILDYEDLTSVAVLNGLAEFLGAPGRLKSTVDSLKKQNPEPLQDKLQNPDEMTEALKKTDLFGLARTPIFEPRRPMAPKSAVVCDGPGLVFFPISGAPDSDITAWLSRLGEVRQGLDRPTLQSWKRQNPGHRSFTVIRHPLLRAYRAFHERIVSGKLAVYRTTLIRAYKARLPEPGEAFANPFAERQAFLIFLHYARLSVLGQCGHQVDPGWASQTAILQGISSFHPVDLVIREDRLQDGLSYLVGPTTESVSEAMVPSAFRAGLDAICDDQVEAAAVAAYLRDYEGFGFGPWRD
ncbi:MAG TPA: nodulation protein NodH [Tabrizicola sp.]|mgnify:CR=1 FL=1|nr:nodulation protein NodH [Tabrizicola sp.]